MGQEGRGKKKTGTGMGPREGRKEASPGNRGRWGEGGSGRSSGGGGEWVGEKGKVAEEEGRE